MHASRVSLPESDYDKSRVAQLRELVSSCPTSTGCWEVKHLMLPGVYAKTGYPSIKLSLSGRPKEVRLSRLFYSLYVGEIPDGCLIRHTCDNEKCINIAHLLPGTPLDNAQDKKLRGRGKGKIAGSKNGNATLTEDIVRNVVLPGFSAGLSNREIADTVGVTPTMISYIKLGRSWTHVTGFSPAAVIPRHGVRKAPDRSHDRDAPFTQQFLDLYTSCLTESAPSCETVQTPCFLFNGVAGYVDKDGYARLAWEGKHRRIHHIAFRLREGRWPKPNYDISHKCRNKLCAAQDHIEELTRTEHSYFAASQGWLSQGHVGQRNHSILSIEQIKQAKELFRDKPDLTDGQVRDMIGASVTEACLADIRKGKTGRHVDVPGFQPVVKQGAAARGSRNNRAKLQPEQVSQIRTRAAAGEHALKLAEEYGVSRRNIDDIVARRTWSDLL